MHRSVKGSARIGSVSHAGAVDSSDLVAADTIAAISTPAGEGAIAIVRMSGLNAIAIGDKIFRGKEKASRFSSHVQHLGEIVTDSESLIDEVLMSIHRAPASYTGEDLVEISCHGGTLVTAKVLEACLRAGARAARPGEFTERAFLNGKMDLTQAEAVIDLIRARTELALRSATEQLEGKLGEKIRSIRKALVDLLAHFEASIDFSEEGIELDEGEKLRTRLDSIREEILALLATADQGRMLRDGVRIVIYGATNAGKSSLLNRLIGYERVIVSDTHGTTRDTIEEIVNLRGIPVRLFDTAGLRTSASDVELEGIARTESSLKQADLRLHIVDRSAPRPSYFQEKTSNGNEIVILNKSDLPEHSDWKNLSALRISCATQEGLRELQEEIIVLLGKGNLRPENPVSINLRHRDCLRRALEACERAREGMSGGLSAEYLAVDLNEALRAVGEVIGSVGVEQILDSVFSQFCIGK
ncbi:MAG TPA: tRNA uridine-5-carboxymethylaminomethyl(34) synthesis GTPase MnmE [Chthoniobacterales bacterium]|jgi:tRNA modification GTPase|nr:tRNA uridine-5-carboxymethylaminomethyl(34) synthesis GTPase MnmE [Chthoniobacterales bacterium]